MSGPPTNSTPLAWAAHGSRFARVHGDAFYGIGRRLVHEGDVRDPGLAEVATGQLADWLAGREDEPAPEPAPGAIDYGELGWRADVEGLRLLSALPGVAARTAGDGFAVRTGNLDNTLNGVVCDACGDEELAELLSFLDGLPAQWYVGGRSALHERLVAAGARPEVDSVVMGGAARELTLDAEGGRTHPCARSPTRRASTPGSASRRTGASSTGRGRGSGCGASCSASRCHGPRRVRMQVAWEDEIATGAISARRHGEVLVVEHLGVRAGSQRMGIGRALLAAAVRAEPDAVHVVLAPTPSSVAFYERLGFVLQRYPPRRSYYTPVRPDLDEEGSTT